MNLKSFIAGACVLALAACGDNAQNPELLKGANFVSAQPGADITLTFDPNEMRVYGRVVNLYNGGYTADGNNIKFEGFASTMMMGEPQAMEAEQEYFQFMPTVEKYELGDGKLTLISGDGKEIVFTQVEELPGEEAPANADAPAAETPAAADAK
ncbi:MAG: META domain-containing protein [Alphaproteobacteria bacterium]|nr:META domain-containing protein [Alphaproteobacteria bacterium]